MGVSKATDLHVVVQCKHYAPDKRIGFGNLQKFIGMTKIHHKADHGVFVSTADFTREAQCLAQLHDIDLIDGSRLNNLIAKVQLAACPQSGS
jgi:restriction system protein